MDMIHVAAETPWHILEEQIRQVPLLEARDGALIYPYENAAITLAEIDYEAVRPTSLYVLKDNLAIQKQLTNELAPRYDPLQLLGSITLRLDDGSEIGLIPPIVEETDSDGPYILDGTHRTLVGRMAGRTAFIAIHITKFRDDCPAAVLPNAWGEIKTYDRVPSDPALKRRYRENPLSLRRNFSALNGSRPRQ
jgi:hypothetical protein